MSAEPHRCRACAAEVRAGALRCEHCGAPRGDLAPCPHCRGEGGVSHHPELRFACDLCGGPRVPLLDASIPSSGREALLLRKAYTARKARKTWQRAAIAGGIALAFTVVPLVLLLCVVGPKLLLLVPGLLFTGLSGALLATALLRSSAREREIEPALDGAWVAVATDISRHRGAPLSAEELSVLLAIEEPQAEELLALVDANESVGVSSVRGARLRVSLKPAMPGDERGADAALAQAAEVEALAVETAAPREKL